MTFRHWIITLIGLASALAAVLFVLAPVEQDSTTYNWPEGPHTESAALPLFPGEPQRMTLTFGCSDLHALGGSGLLLSTTMPDGADVEQRDTGGLTVRMADGGPARVEVAVAGSRIAPAQQVRTSCTWRIRVDEHGTSVIVDGASAGHTPGKPVVTGLFTDLHGETGLNATIVPDTRYESTPSASKVVLGLLTLAGVGTLLVLVRRWDSTCTTRVRLLPGGWWRPRGPDAVVGSTLLAWWVVGSPTVDDGYIITMLKAAEETGFVGNYFRWFNAPEAPFSWFYTFYQPFVDSGVLLLRLPSVLLGAVLWLIVDRCLLRRLVPGPARVARWCAAATFLLWYVQFGVGLRPEPWVMLGTVGVLVLVERAVATRALTPLAVAVVVAGATIAVTPTGIVALAPFVAALPSLIRIVWRYWPVVVPVLLASAASALLPMFADQSLATVLHSVNVRTAIGPSHGVVDEPMRYESLFAPSEGGLNRRMPLMLLWLSMAMLGVLLLARRVPGLAKGPTRRALIVALLFFAVLTFTPTKYFHHFGAIGAIATALLAALAHTLARGALRRAWQHAVLVLAVAIVASIALEVPVRWWFLAALTVPWAHEAPNLAGITFSDAVLTVGIVLAAAFPALALVRVVSARLRDRADAAPRPDRSRRVRLPSAAPLLVALALGTVVLEVFSMAFVLLPRANTYSMAGSTLDGLTGGCGIGGWLTVEPDVAAGVLTPAADSPPARLDGFSVNGGYGEAVSSGTARADASREGVSGDTDGHGENPVAGAPEDTPAAEDADTTAGSGSTEDADTAEETAPAAPYGTPEAPAWGSGGSEGTLTTAWYPIPEGSGSPDAPPLVVPVGGAGAVSATVQFADADGTVRTERDLHLPAGTWREARLEPAGAERVRLVAVDEHDGRGWIAIGTPRLPEVVPLREHIPRDEPVLLDWLDAFFLPCRQPAAVADGVTQPVRYRIATGPQDRWLTGMSFSHKMGGPYAPLLDVAEQTRLPTYLRGDKLREPISVIRLDYPVAALEAVRPFPVSADPDPR